jgi:uncharacterized membrane protein
MILRRASSELRLLVEAFFAIGLCFLTLAVPLALDGKWTAAVWSLEGAAMLWSGLRQSRYELRYAGMALLVLGGAAFLLSEHRTHGLTPVVNSFFMGTFVLALAHLGVGFQLHRAAADKIRLSEKQAVPFFGVLGFLWWVGGGVIELSHAIPRLFGESQSVMVHAYVIFFALTSLAFQSLSVKLRWKLPGWAPQGLMPVIGCLALLLLTTGGHPFADVGALAWVAAFGIHYRWLYQQEINRGAVFSAFQHQSAIWILTFLLSWEAYWLASRFIAVESVWPYTSLAVVPGLLAFGVIRSKPESSWPVGPHRNSYLGAGILPLLVGAALWLAYLNFTHSGNPRFLPYLPIANPIDLAQIFILMAWGHWYLEAKKARLALLPSNRDFAVAIGGLSFVWLTASLLRTLHHWAGLPWEFSELFASHLVQAALSIFWSVVALALMSLATRRSWRVLWLTGAGLLGLVVTKLFLVDLSGRGTLERVVSFIGTGVLLLVIGYLAPIPPDARPSAVEVK